MTQESRDITIKFQFCFTWYPRKSFEIKFCDSELVQCFDDLSISKLSLDPERRLRSRHGFLPWYGCRGMMQAASWLEFLQCSSVGERRVSIVPTEESMVWSWRWLLLMRGVGLAGGRIGCNIRPLSIGRSSIRSSTQSEVRRASASWEEEVHRKLLVQLMLTWVVHIDKTWGYI